jgi:hypothetical protein
MVGAFRGPIMNTKGELIGEYKQVKRWEYTSVEKQSREIVLELLQRIVILLALLLIVLT